MTTYNSNGALLAHLKAGSEEALRISHEQAQANASLNNARITAQPVQHLIADPRETQLIAMFRCIDDRAQKTMMAMMGVAFQMHKKVGK